jgi:hypothetical protein
VTGISGGSVLAACCACWLAVCRISAASLAAGDELLASRADSSADAVEEGLLEDCSSLCFACEESVEGIDGEGIEGDGIEGDGIDGVALGLLLGEGIGGGALDCDCCCSVLHDCNASNISTKVNAFEVICNIFFIAGCLGIVTIQAST